MLLSCLLPNHISRVCKPVLDGTTWIAGAHTVNRPTARECCGYLVSVALLLLPSLLLVSLVFVLEKGQVQYMASMATTVLTLLCLLPAIILAKVESFDIKF